MYHLETPARLASESVAGRSSAQVSESSAEKPKITLPVITETPKTQILTSYSYVTQDIRKTALITGAIVATQIILFFIINQR